MLPRASGAFEAEPDHRFASFDQTMDEFMRARGVPGGSLAVLKDGRLVYARGYGYADRDARTPATPTTLFRLASISKPITAVTVLKLVEEGRLDLDARAFDLLKLQPLPGQTAAARMRSVTVGQLLHHTGGWDRDHSFDPMFRPREIARAAGTPPPAGPEAIIRYMLGKPLDFDPGTRFAYSNFGYCVLGRIIERVTGTPYEAHVKKAVLGPAGIRNMRIGSSLVSGPNETRYYTPRNQEVPSVFGEERRRVPQPYGGFNLEAMDAHGGWIASAVDLARFAAALHDEHRSPLLKRESFPKLYAPPAPPVSRKEDGTLEATYYGCGWSVRPVANRGANYWHNGSLPGTNTWLVRRWDGLAWVALFNLRSEDRQLPDTAIDGALHRAAAQVKDWPTADLFAQFR